MPQHRLRRAGTAPALWERAQVLGQTPEGTGAIRKGVIPAWPDAGKATLHTPGAQVGTPLQQETQEPRRVQPLATQVVKGLRGIIHRERQRSLFSLAQRRLEPSESCLQLHQNESCKVRADKHSQPWQAG